MDKIILKKKEDILSNLESLDKFINANNSIFDYYKPDAGVVCFPRLKQNIDDIHFCKALFEEHNISVLPGFAFEVSGHFRLNFGINQIKFREALESMQIFSDKLYK